MAINVGSMRAMGSMLVRHIGIQTRIHICDRGSIFVGQIGIHVSPLNLGSTLGSMFATGSMLAPGSMLGSSFLRHIGIHVRKRGSMYYLMRWDPCARRDPCSRSGIHACDGIHVRGGTQCL